MNRLKTLAKRRKVRAFRTRARVRGTEERPRVSVFRTNMHIYAQMIDDENGRTLCEANSKAMKIGYGGNVQAAKAVGEELGRKAKEISVERVGFDRGSYRYHGRVKALADALRSSGLKF
jgi:large subunit ribosomal protein L18